MEENFSSFLDENFKDNIDLLYARVLESERGRLFDQAILGSLHLSFKEVKTIWRREEYFDLGLTKREVALILMARSDMLPLAFKPWFVDRSYQCIFCNLNLPEGGEHFIKVCPAWREFRSQKLCDFSFLDILGGEAGWKELASFIGKALNCRTLLGEAVV